MWKYLLSPKLIFCQFWNVTEGANCTVHLLWDDHVRVTNNVTLPFSCLTPAVGGCYTAARYALKTVNAPTLSLSATAGITNMCFTVNSALEDQSGVGFTVEDKIVFSETSCIVSQDLFIARIDVAVRVFCSYAWDIVDWAVHKPHVQRP
jgi:hypothetical protein